MAARAPSVLDSAVGEHNEKNTSPIQEAMKKMQHSNGARTNGSNEKDGEGGEKGKTTNSEGRIGTPTAGHNGKEITRSGGGQIATSTEARGE